MPSYVANGNIAPFRFVKLDSTADQKVLQAGANDVVAGISAESTNQAPLSDLVSTAYAAVAGQSLHVYDVPAEPVWLEAGGSFSAGTKLVADTNGKGVAISASTKNNVGAVALQTSGGAGQLVLVSPTPFGTDPG